MPATHSWLETRPFAPGFELDGQYTIDRQLEGAGMSDVYLARRSDGLPVVIKVLAAGQGARADGLLRRFRREIHALTTIRHPNIVRLLDHGTAHLAGRSLPYLVTEHYPGETLEERHRTVRAEPCWAVRIVLRLARALAWVHKLGFLHRDLKPANVLLAAPDRPVLLDFGLVKLTAPGHPLGRSSEALLGSCEFMPPEFLGLGTPGERSDVYGLGGVLLWLLTGVPANPVPHAGAASPSVTLGELIRAMYAPRPTRVAFPHLDPGLERLWRRALAPDPDERYPSMQDFAEELEEWSRRHPPSAGAAP